MSLNNKTEAGLFGLGGGVVGAAVSSQLGGMGLAVAGTAVGITAAPVIAAGAIVGLAAYGVKKALSSDHPATASQEKQKAQSVEEWLSTTVYVGGQPDKKPDNGKV